jgi:hypothetical protein
MKLIDADALLNFMEHEDESADWQMAEIVEWVEQQPTIEAKPVVHAYWEKGCNDEYISISWWTCSHCGKGALTKEETIYDQVLTDYCPYCGAQMDEVIV